MMSRLSRLPTKQAVTAATFIALAAISAVLGSVGMFEVAWAALMALIAGLIALVAVTRTGKSNFSQSGGDDAREPSGERSGEAANRLGEQRVLTSIESERRHAHQRHSELVERLGDLERSVSGLQDEISRLARALDEREAGEDRPGS